MKAHSLPPSILRDGPAKLVYLDLNHWIGLARASKTGSNTAGYAEALELARHVRRSGDVVFPLSSTHYMEMATIRDANRRADLAAAMEELSEFATILSSTIIREVELEAALDKLVAPPLSNFIPVQLIGRGDGYAFGRRGGFRIVDANDEDALDKVRKGWPDGPEAFDVWFAEAERGAQRRFLAGPPDSDILALKDQGWNPNAARDVAQRRVKQHCDLAAELQKDPRWRRGRLRDIISARYLGIEMLHELTRALLARGLTLRVAFPDTVIARSLIDSMPSADVYVSLVTAVHRNSESKWTTNDIFDIDALVTAAAYCDVVVTDKQRCSNLRATGVASRLGTRVCATAYELTATLDHRN